MPVVVPSLVVVVLMRVVVVVADRGHACLYNGTIWLHKYSSRCRFVVVAHTILPCYVATYSMNGNSRIASCPNRRTACSAVGLTWIFNDGGRKKMVMVQSAATTCFLYNMSAPFSYPVPG